MPQNFDYGTAISYAANSLPASWDINRRLKAQQ